MKVKPWDSLCHFQKISQKKKREEEEKEEIWIKELYVHNHSIAQQKEKKKEIKIL